VDPLAFWIGFNRVRGIGPVRLRKLIDAFGSIEAAWQATELQLAQAGLDRRSLAALAEVRERTSLARELDALEKAQVKALTWDDPDYPQRLLAISDPPPVLFVRGTLLPEDDLAIAVVGTRVASNYGREAAQSLARDLARNQITVVSGLAKGIDAVAHRAALEAGGRTLAVLGSGVDVVYPWENQHLAVDIQSHGALISEYPLGTKPDAFNFPPRNRIISGLSRGVVVVEAGERSGALITAVFAAEQGRDVFAVPGSIFASGSRGANRLIRDGARPALSIQDILDELNPSAAPAQLEARLLLPVDPLEANVFAQLGEEPRHIDEVGRALDLPAALVSSTLAMMELKGLVQRVDGMSYVRMRESLSVYSPGISREEG
jgi:DNA processing protein